MLLYYYSEGVDELHYSPPPKEDRNILASLLGNFHAVYFICYSQWHQVALATDRKYIENRVIFQSKRPFVDKNQQNLGYKRKRKNWAGIRFHFCNTPGGVWSCMEDGAWNHGTARMECSHVWWSQGVIVCHQQAGAFVCPCGVGQNNSSLPHRLWLVFILAPIIIYMCQPSLCTDLFKRLCEAIPFKVSLLVWDSLLVVPCGDWMERYFLVLSVQVRTDPHVIVP